MIVATAGHVDHGKTSLVRQLTGVETDRLEEEKQRGLSINLGYAYLPTQSKLPIGFIDVPGHQRFINTMICGISGIDVGMLVVAADDGVMPQTREHLDVLQVLGVPKLVLVITKVDKVEESQRQAVEQALHTLLAGYRFEHLNTFNVDNLNGLGIDGLRRFLLSIAGNDTARPQDGAFRMAIDRAFNVKGAGLVVTGTTSSGAVHVGETLSLFPANVEARVRALRVHDDEATLATAGQRCAINLAGGATLDDVARGHWLLGAQCGPASAVIDADVTLLASAPFALKHLAPVKIHIGAQRVAARLALLDTPAGTKRLGPGETALAQLRLEAPLPAYTSQRFVLRDHAENVTLGGGVVLDPAAFIRRRSSEATRQWLDTLRNPDPQQALEQLLANTGLVELTQFATARNLLAASKDDLVKNIVQQQAAVHWGAAEGEYLASKAARERARKTLHGQLAKWHQAHPNAAGMKVSELNRAWQPANELPLVTHVLTGEIQQGAIVLTEGHLRLAAFKPGKASELEKAWAAYQAFLHSRGMHIPLLSETTGHTRLPIPTLRKAANAAVKEGRAFQISERRYALPADLLALGRGVLKSWQAGEEISVIALKNEWGLGRNLVVEIVEFFDSVRFTARRGNARVVLDPEVLEQRFGTARE